MPTTKKKVNEPPRKAAAEPPVHRTPRRDQVSEAYEAALRDFTAGLDLLRRGNYAEAKGHFDAVVKASSASEPVLAQRATTYAAVCVTRLAPPPPDPATAEELYLAGVVKANEHRLDEATALLDRLIALAPASPGALYARAAVRALQGLAESAVSDLRAAIALDPQLRFQAQNDADFEKIRDEAVFIDVIEPTPNRE